MQLYGSTEAESIHEMLCVLVDLKVAMVGGGWVGVKQLVISFVLKLRPHYFIS